MGRKRKHQSNAERQAAYRASKRNVNASVTPPIPPGKRVTQCARYQYIGDFGYGPNYARWITSDLCPPGRCENCDRERRLLGVVPRPEEEHQQGAGGQDDR